MIILSQDPPLPADLNGESFCALLGTHCRFDYQQLVLRCYCFIYIYLHELLSLIYRDK